MCFLKFILFLFLIGKSFQLAIITPQINLIGSDTDTVQRSNFFFQGRLMLTFWHWVLNQWKYRLPVVPKSRFPSHVSTQNMLERSSTKDLANLCPLQISFPCLDPWLYLVRTITGIQGLKPRPGTWSCSGVEIISVIHKDPCGGTRLL